MGDKLVPFNKQGSTDPELNELLHALRRTQSEIGQAYNHFNFASDPDLVEACIYEITSLQCRYNYLLRCIKERQSCAAMRILPGCEL